MFTACAAPAPAPASEAPQVAQLLEGKQGLQCDPGKEHWHATTQPVRGGVLKKGLAAASASATLDMTTPGATNTRIPQVYRHLVRPRSCYYEDTAVEPDMAKSWQTSPDGLTWTFSLRDDIKWHNKPPVNGRPFTAADVAWTIEMQKGGAQLRTYWESITHEELNPSTVILKLKDPDADFLGKLSENANVIFPHEVKEQFGDFKTAAVGTGPFMLKQSLANQSTILERNPDWKEMGVDGKPLPYIDEVQALVFEDYAAEVAAVRAGLLDVNSVFGFQKLDADALVQSNPKLHPYKGIAGTVGGLYFNLTAKPYDDARIRKAFAFALNGDDIIEAGRQGGAVRSGFLPSGIQDYAWSSDEAKEKFKQDPARAKQVLAEAGYGSTPLEVTMETATQYTQEAEVAQRQLQAAGVKVNISVQPGASTATIMGRKTFGFLYGVPTGASYMVDRWFGAPIRTGGSTNLLGLSDPQVDNLSVAQSREMDPARRKQIVRSLQDRLYDLMPWAPVSANIYYHFVSCQTQNLRPPHQTRNEEGMEAAWLNSAGC